MEFGIVRPLTVAIKSAPSKTNSIRIISNTSQELRHTLEFEGALLS